MEVLGSSKSGVVLGRSRGELDFRKDKELYFIHKMN